MTESIQYVEDTYEELDAYVREMEVAMEDLVEEYLSEFHIDGYMLSVSSQNYDLANKSDEVFNKAFDSFVLGFLAFLYSKIMIGASLTVSDLVLRGIKAIGDEEMLVQKMVGYKNGKMVRGGYLDNLGKMGILRIKFHDYVVKAVSSGQRMNKFLRDAKPLFVSKKTRSAFAQYYMRYAYDSVNQTMNSIALYVANERKLTHFEYEGGLVKDSRPFCVEHAGDIYTRKDAEEFDKEDWKGKIHGVPFLIAVGGYNCQHSIKWLPNIK